VRLPELEVIVSGRVDGISYDAEAESLCIEEIKTVRVEVEEIPSPVLEEYWLQAALYGHLVLMETDHDTVQLRLVLYHLDRDEETLLTRIKCREELTQTFTESIFFYEKLYQDQQAWLQVRELSLSDLDFPYPEYRVGQRDMAVAVYRAAGEGSQLVLQAPTGIGKTMATLYPAIRSLEPGRTARVFYLSARSSTQMLARQAVSDLEAQGARLRSVTLTAKDKVCLTPGAPCHPDHCQYARGYYDRLHSSLDEMLESTEHFDRDAIHKAAEAHQLCPFELSLDLASRCDVIISDYNYVFDPVVHLRRFFDTGETDSVGLIDEAHNLVDRGREMFSASINRSDYLALARATKDRKPAIRKIAQKVSRAIIAFRKTGQATYETNGFIADDQLPVNVMNAMQSFCAGAELELRIESAVTEEWRSSLLSLYFDTLRFLRTAEGFDQDYRVLLTPQGRQERLRLYCVDPSRQLRDGFERLHAAICFSATMHPRRYFERMFGVNDTADWYRLPTPFDPSRFGVHIAGFVDTSYRGRNDSLGMLTELIARILRSRSGNYLVFFPSHEYMNRVLEQFGERFPEFDTIAQTRDMDEDSREAFIARFDAGPICGFAVMGGIFSEGIDLKGHRLIGAIVVGVGLPQIGVERDMVKNFFPESGFEFAYQYPGIIKVLQTAGRVIRDEDDQGILCLVDRRYLERRYQALLPEEWQCHQSTDVDDLAMQLTGFWENLESDITGHTLQIDAG
jgi:DNA excision repair protein ERCC-2